MRVREFEQQLAADGCVLERTSGDHHMWRLPNGHVFAVPFGGKHNEVKSYLAAKYRRFRRMEAVCRK